MDIFLVVLFLLLGIAFFLLEIFFLPGISVGGVAGTVFVVGGVWYAFTYLGTTAGWLSLAAGAVVFVVAVWLFMRAKVLERMSLTTELKDDDTPDAVSGIKVGDTGQALSRLAPMGRAVIAGVEVEVKSQNGFIDVGTPVRVVETDHRTIIVTPLS